MTQADQIEHERHVAAILGIRRPPDTPRSALSTWLSSNVLTALVGVIGTAVVGTLLTGQIQNRARHNEQERATQATRIPSQNEVVGKVLQRVGTFLSATDDLLVTVHSGYEERERTPDEVEKLRE